MNIDLMQRVKSINKIPYELAHKCKEIIQKNIEEIEGMLETIIIYPIDKSRW